MQAGFRQSVLTIAHSTALGGHLGRAKMRNRVQANFYWPGVGQDVTRFVRSCDYCQTSDRGRIKPVPLLFLPITETAFDRVAVDIIGPVEPRASDRSKYILTMVDFATRCPEAPLLSSIGATTVPEAMFSIFCRICFPK